MHLRSVDGVHLSRTSVAAIAIGILAAAGAFALASYAARMGLRTAGIFVSAAASAHEIRLRTATAHLWFEEVAAGDTFRTVRSVRSHLDSAVAVAETLGQLGRTRVGLGGPLLSSGAFRLLDRVMVGIADFRESIDRRHAMGAGAGAGSPMDELSDRAFETLAADVGALEREAASSLADALLRLRRQQILLIAVALVLALACAALALWNARRRSAAHRQSRAANQQLRAIEQQLRAANQQLSAGEQQLRAANQQLSAHEQQLRASNQQLRASQQTLVASEERYRMVLEYMSDAVAVYQTVDNGDDFIFVEFNKAGQKIENTPRDKVVGRRVTEVFPGVGEFGLLEVFARVWRTGVAEHFPMSFYRDAHIAGWRDNYVYRLPTGEVVAVYRDETERMQSLEALKLSEEIHRTLAENIPGLVYRVHVREHGRVEFFNSLLESIAGYRADELAAGEVCSMESLIHEEDRGKVVDQVKTALKTLKPFSLDYRLRTKSGGIRRLLERGQPILGRDGAPQYIDGVIFDMTEQGRAARERDRFFNNSVDMLCIAGFDGHFKQVNPAWTNTLGWSAEELLSKPWLDFVHPDDREATVNAKSRLDGDREVLAFENRYRCKDGTYRWISWNSFPQRDEGIIFAVARDVTAQRQAAEAVIESESRLRSIMDATPIGMHQYRLEDDGRLVFEGGNPAADRILGVDNSMFIGKTIEEAFPPLAGTEVPAKYREAARNGVPWSTEQITYKDDRIVGAFEVHAFRTSPGRMVAAFEDITSRKQAEAALRASEARFRVYYESAPAAYQSLDERGCLTDVNDNWLSTLGYTREEVIGRSFADFLVSGDKPLFQERFPVFKAAGETRNVEFNLVRKDGKRIVGLFYGRISRDEKGAFERTHCVFHDITERKRVMDEMQRTQRLESIGILAGGIAHDFNNLLGGLFGFIEMAREYGKVDETAAEYLDKALGAFQRAKDLTQQLLTFSRGGEPVKRTVVLDQVIKGAAELALSGSNVHAKITMRDRSLIAEVDQGQIAQTVSNLVLNARQAMPTGGIVQIECARCRIAREDGLPVDPGEYIRIRVADQGTGIAADHLEKIFDPFFTTKQTGSGLGLATSYSIVKRHGGHIAVSSKLGAGSTFDVYVPAFSGSAADPVAVQPAPARGTGRILLMDDEEILLDVGKETLVALGYTVDCARDGGTAVKMYREAMERGRPYGLVILDLTVPGGMGGKETLGKLREVDPKVRAIVSSGYSEDPVMANPKEYGFAGVTGKPYRLAELGQAVAVALGN